MFEEAQLYSPVTSDGDEVTVHLAHDHPGANDPEYRRRRNEIAALALAWEPGTPVPDVRYTEDEQNVWRTVCRELAPKHDKLAIREFLDAKEALDLPEPDIIHEVIGHGHLLATPTFSELHRLTGEATHRLKDEENLRFLSRVFWFTVEFGVVVEDGELRAYGAGILSSYGEIDEFRDMELRPIDLAEMGTAEYDITQYQPVLYRADSMDEIREVVGGFFVTCTDESIAELRADAPAPVG